MSVSPEMQKVIKETIDTTAREILAVSREQKYNEVSDLFAALEKKMGSAIQGMRSDMEHMFTDLESKLHESIKDSIKEYKTKVEKVEEGYVELDKKTVKYDLTTNAIITVGSVALLAVVAKLLGVINL